MNARGLFVRIFFAIWIAMSLAVAGFAGVYTQDSRIQADRGRAFGEEVLSIVGESAYAQVTSGDAQTARRSFDRIAERAGVRLYLVDAGKTLVSSAGPASRKMLQVAAELADEEAPDPHSFVDGKVERHLVAVPLHRGVLITSFPPRPSRAALFVGDSRTLPLKFLVVVLAFGLVAWLLARYIIRPLDTLRSAAQRIAVGELDVRVSDHLTGASPEIEALGRDFDAMTERIGALLENQERLLRDVSHELRSPLARLTVALALARKRLGDAPSHELDRIEREADRLAQLISQILELARLGADSPLPDETFELAEVVEHIVRDAEYEARAQGRSVRLVCRARPLVRGTSSAVHSAIENVVRNAIGFTPDGTHVDVELQATPEHAYVVVRDMGPGVPDEALPAIFRPFYRVGTDRDRKTGGTGIGLAIAHRIVERHGGTIEAVNRAPSGLEIVFRFPSVAHTR